MRHPFWMVTHPILLACLVTSLSAQPVLSPEGDTGLGGGTATGHEDALAAENSIGPLTIDWLAGLDEMPAGRGFVTAFLPAEPTMTPTPWRARGDFNNDGAVDFGDFLFLLQRWGEEYEGLIVGFDDFLNMMDDWGVVEEPTPTPEPTPTSTPEPTPTSSPTPEPTPEPTPTATPSPTPTPAFEELTVLLPGDVPLVMVRIPAGSFVMGAPADERGSWPRERPQTHVTLTKNFYMGKYPVTQAQWGALMAVNPSHFSGANRPVENMSYQETQNYIAALNAHIVATGQGPVTMRLPTEAEWEYASRAGTTTRFYFGDSLDCLDYDNDCAAGVLPGNRTDYMWYSVNSGGQTQPVGQKLPNPWGLYDMAGNVQELCQDRISSARMENYPGGSVTNPTGPLTGDGRVARGGSWMDPTQNCRSANRWALGDIWVRLNTFGFRLAGTM